MAVILKKQQLQAVEKLKNGKILCGDVGSGKSITSLAYYYQKVCQGVIPVNDKSDIVKMKTPRNLLVITTAKKRNSLDWEREMARYGLSKDPEDNYNHITCVVDSWNNIKKYKDLSGWFIIFDEQRVVGSGAWVKTFLNLARKNQWILLSATPGDVWTDYIPVFVANGFYRNKTEFMKRHAVYNRYAKYPKVDRFVETRRLEKLREQLLVDMPVPRHTIRNHKNIIVNYDRDLYRTVVRDRWNPYKNEPIPDISNTFALMRRIINSDTSRIYAIGKIISKHAKIIIFYNFDFELFMLREFCQKQGFTYSEWNGHKHESIPSSEKWVYLVQYTAGSEAWECIETDTMVFYSLNYSWRVMTQCEGRIDRLNTPFTDLWYYTLRSQSGLDLAITKALRAKKNFNERAFKMT